MAPKKNEPTPTSEKQGTIEIAYVKLAGNDVTLQKVVDAFTTLINRPAANGTAISTAKRVNSLPAGAATGLPSGNGADALVDADEPIDVAPEQSVDTEASPPSAPKTTPRKHTVPTAIPIDTETGTSIDEYVKQYKLESNEEKYLALAGWLKAHRQVPLKAGIVVTLYKHLDWTLPADVTMSLRRMVSKQYQWLERTSVGEYQIIQLGESKLGKLKV